MTMLPKTTGELRRYLETFPDDMRLYIDVDEENVRPDWYDVIVIIEEINGNTEKVMTFLPRITHSS